MKPCHCPKTLEALTKAHCRSAPCGAAAMQTRTRERGGACHQSPPRFRLRPEPVSVLAEVRRAGKTCTIHSRGPLLEHAVRWRLKRAPFNVVDHADLLAETC